MNYVPSRDYLRHKISASYTPNNISPYIQSSDTDIDSVYRPRREPYNVTRDQLEKENQRIQKLDQCLAKIDKYLSKTQTKPQFGTERQTGGGGWSAISGQLGETPPFSESQHPKQLRFDQGLKLEPSTTCLTRNKKYSYNIQEANGQTYVQTQLVSHTLHNLNPRLPTLLQQHRLMSNLFSCTSVGKIRGLHLESAHQALSTQQLVSLESNRGRLQNIQTIIDLNCQISTRIKDLSKLMKMPSTRDVSS